MKKITVKHYINKRLKSKPLYVRVIYDRKDTSFPSEIITNTNPSEEKLLTDSKLRRELEYEVEIITAIIEFCIKVSKDQFSLSQVNIATLIGSWKDSVCNIYEVFYFSNKDVRQDIRKPLINFISQKTQINAKTLELLVSHNIEELDVLIDLANNHNIYSDNIKYSITFCKWLYDFENIHYGDETKRWIYGADNMFCFYEWYTKNRKDQFLEYALKKNKLPEAFVRKRVEDFDYKLHEKFELNLFFSNFTDTKRNPR